MSARRSRRVDQPTDPSDELETRRHGGGLRILKAEFGYIIPIVETMAAIKYSNTQDTISDAKTESLLGLWFGVILIEAILIPVVATYPGHNNLWSRL